MGKLIAEDIWGFLIPLVIIPGFLIAVIWLPGVLFWFRDKEIKDMKSLDLAIFAAENRLEFEQESRFVKSLLTKRYLRPLGKYGMRNIFIYRYGPANAYIFDYEFQPQAGYSQNWIIILVDFATASFPKFKIDKHNPDLLSRPNLHMFLTSAEPNELPKWGKGNMSVYSTRKTRKTLLKSLERKPQSLKLIQSSDFRGLFFDADCACLYLDGSLNENMSEHQQLEKRARQIVELFEDM